MTGDSTSARRTPPATRRRIGGAVASALAVALVTLPGATASDQRAAVVAHTPAAGAAPAAPGTELVDLRTARSRTWAQPDGSRVTRIYQRPVNAGEAGALRRIDPTLRRAGDAWVNGPAGVDVRVPSSLGDGPVEVGHRGREIALQLRGADVEADVEGAVASFPDVADGVTARWTSQPGGIKEELVLDDAQAPSSFVFDVRASDGLRLVDRRDGSIDAVGARGSTAFTLAAPFAYDGGRRLAPERAVTMRSERFGTGWTVRLRLDRRWLTAPGRAFPVTIDPTVDAPAVADCQLDANLPTTSFCADPSMIVGRQAGHDHNGLVRFDLEGTMPAEANIMRAKVLAYAEENLDAISRPVEAFRVTAAWDDDATWANRTAIDPWARAGGDAAATPEDTSPAPVRSQWSDWHVTDTARGWFDGSVPNHGVLLRSQAVVSDLDTGTDFTTSESSSSHLWPFLEVVWFGRVGQMPDFTIDQHAIDDRQTLGVNVAGGNMLLRGTDMEIAGRGLDLSIGWAMNSQDDWQGQLGQSTRLTVGNDIRLDECSRNGSLCFTGPSGYRARFVRNPDGSYVTPPGVNATLVKERDGSWTMTFHRTGIRYRFFASSDDTFLTDVVDRNGNTIHFDYVSSRLDRIVDTQGRQIDVDRNADGDVTRIEDPTGRAWEYHYGTGRQLAAIVDPEGAVTEYRFDEHDRLDRLIDGRGNRTFVTYDNAGRVSAVRREIDGTPGRDVTTTYAYAGPTAPCVAGRDVGKTIVVDPRGKDTTYCWNQQGQVTKARDALGRDRTTSYTPNGDTADYAAFVGTGNPATTTLRYDTSNNLQQADFPAGERETWTHWSAASDPTDPLRRYRVQSHVDAQGADTFFGWDARGNLTDVKDNATTPRNQATLAYNADGTLRSATDGNGNATTFSYDGSGNLTQVTPPAVSAPSALGSTRYAYDALSRVRTVTDGRGATLTLAYDDRDRVERVTAGDGSWIAYAYDDNGNPVSRTSSAGASTTYAYDKLNRRTTEDFPGAGDNGYGYDKSGNLTSLTDLGGTAAYAYDDVDRVRSIVSPRPGGGTDTLTYAYTDPSAGNPFTRRTATLPGGGVQQVDRDLSGKLADIVLRGPGGTTQLRRIMDYTSGSAERRLLQVMTDEAGNRTLYTYADGAEDVGRMTRIRNLNAANALVQELRYTYDRAGNRLSRSNTVGGTTTWLSYAYNAANQLCWRDDAPSANPCATPPAGALETYTYDAAGQQLGGANRLTWDVWGRLASINGQALGYLSPTSGELTSFGSQLFQSNLFGISRAVDGGVVTNLVRDPDTGLAVSQTTGGTKRWLLTNHLGSTLALTDGTGAVTRRYTYGADGVSSELGTGSGPEPLLWFAGGHRPGNGSMLHYGVRFYDWNPARWTSQDPLRQYEDLLEANRYVYVGGNPINYTDPAGTNIIEDGAGWVKDRGEDAADFVGDNAGACAKGGAGGAAGGAVSGAITGGPRGAAIGGAAGGAGGCVSGVVGKNL